MKKYIEGNIWKLGNNIDTDVIYPGKYLPIIEPEEMAEHTLEGIDPDFPKKIKKGDIIVAGKNFGCGSSREQAATSLKTAGIGCIIAVSYARIFFRNAINQALPLIVSEDAVTLVKEGDTIGVDFNKGTIQIQQKILRFHPLPDVVMEILEAGGLIERTKKKLTIQS
jgi:3-isopropylmalate/(R)-2-methylmalate dehydratase small subunit